MHSISAFMVCALIQGRCLTWKYPLHECCILGNITYTVKWVFSTYHWLIFSSDRKLITRWKFLSSRSPRYNQLKIHHKAREFKKWSYMYVNRISHRSSYGIGSLVIYRCCKLLNGISIKLSRGSAKSTLRLQEDGTETPCPSEHEDTTRVSNNRPR